jgi:hypothetical protein
MGRLAQSAEILWVVRDEFIVSKMEYDAALVSMDLAEVLLQLQRMHHVKALARQNRGSRGLPGSAFSGGGTRREPLRKKA